jgi:homoserine kinase type II
MAVYTDVTPEDMADFLTHYDLGKLLSFKGIAEGVQNSNFLLHLSSGSYILTLFEKGTESNGLPFFLGLMGHLQAKGVNCPLPVKNKQGEALSKLAGRPATIITFLDGMSMRRKDRDQCYQVGQTLAEFHVKGEGFALTRENTLGVKDWRPLFEKSGIRANEVQAGLYDFITNELEFLEKNWVKNLPKGVIHADLFPDNVFFLEGKLSGIIDFYFACNDFLAYDLAILLNAWVFDAPNDYNFAKGSAMIAGYTSVRKLSQDELQALPLLCRGACVRFMLTRLYDWLNVPAGALVRPHDPLEYATKLRFHQRVQTAGEYGA